MHTLRVINPDDYLETENGRVFTPERSAAAWSQAYAALESCCQAATAETRFYLVMGVQGAGKSTWLKQNNHQLGPYAVCFDAALPARRHRVRALEIAARFGVPSVAVWINAPLQTALERNKLRTPDKQVPEEAVRSVFSLLEAPVMEEGFVEIIEVPV